MDPEKKPEETTEYADHNAQTPQQQPDIRSEAVAIRHGRKIVYGYILAAILVALGAAGGYWYKRHHEKPAAKSSAAVSKVDTSVHKPSATPSPVPSIPDAVNPINPASIPLGTGHVSSAPEAGYVDFCNPRGISTGPEPSLPWIDTATLTWNSEAKPAVEGSVSWAGSASYTDSVSGDTRTIATDDLPIGHDTGVFPIGASDPVYRYDRNPNRIISQPTTWDLPANPTAATTPGCTQDGPIGILSDGVFLFNALDEQDRDAGVTEVQDQWQGHPQSAGMYHHHTVPDYMFSANTAKSTSTLVGYALDGYGIYLERDANGKVLTDANLDACHGRTSEVMWDGKMTDIYHYDATLEYPYTVGCYHGTPIKITQPSKR